MKYNRTRSIQFVLYKLLSLSLVSLYCYDVHRKDPYTEHYDVVKFNEYMDLNNLAKVLEKLLNKFPGMFVRNISDLIIFS